MFYVYGLYEKNDLVYVGMTGQLRNRLKNHRHLGKNFDQSRILYKTSERIEAAEREKQIILEERPKLNQIYLNPSNNPNGRPQKYPNLGGMSEKIRVPQELLSEMERLFTELDRIAVRIDPCETLSGFCDSLSEIEIEDQWKNEQIIDILRVTEVGRR